MDILKDRYSITELSERLNVTDHALRYYEKEFNLNIPKDDRGRRYYSTENANIMYQIKTMRDEGLEIKAIKKILQAENVQIDPPPVIANENEVSIVPANTREANLQIKQFFEEFSNQITDCVTVEVAAAREQFARDLLKTKLELGACVENSARKIESKLERHFAEVDRSLGLWREKNKKGLFKRFFRKV